MSELEWLDRMWGILELCFIIFLGLIILLNLWGYLLYEPAETFSRVGCETPISSIKKSVGRG